MTDIVLPPPHTALSDHHQPLAAVAAMLQELAQQLPPDSPDKVLQAREYLQHMLRLLQACGMNSLQQLLHAMHAPLHSSVLNAEPVADKTAELLQLAVRDALDYLHALQSARGADAQHLFASYRALRRLSGKDSAHPADLWDTPWPVPALPAPANVVAAQPGAELRAQLDQHVLALLQTGDPVFCAALHQLCLGLAAHAEDATLWQLAAAWLQALEHGLLEIDIYAKRMLSRLLGYYTSFAKAQTPPSPALLRDLLFFCAQAADAARQRDLPAPELLQHICQQCQDTPPAPQPAVELQATLPAALAAAPEIHPTKTLASGLASTSTQVRPDSGFLQQAEQLSQQLSQALTQWQAQDSTLDADTAQHAAELSRQAWGAGCTEIATVAYQLQRCLQRLPVTASQAQRQTCLLAAEEIRRLLHQFAAGFLRRAQPQVMDALYQLYAQQSAALDAVPQSPAPAADEAPGSHEPEGTDTPGTAPETVHDTSPAAQDADASPDTAPDAQDTDTRATADSAASPTLVPASPVLDAMHFSVFEDEMHTLWPRLQSALRHWVRAPQDQPARQIVLRSLHTLKGSARLAGAMAWASQVHALEGLALEAPQDDSPRGPASLLAPVEALRIAFVALQQEMDERYPERQQRQLQQQPLDAVARHAQGLWHSLDKGQQALASSQMSMQETTATLQKLRMQIRDCAAWADTLMLHGDAELPGEWHEELHDLVRALHDCTDDLGTAQQQLRQSMGEVQQVFSSQNHQLRALQHTLLYARLLPLSHLRERLQACVEQAAQACGKSVQLHWQGADTMMERSVQEALAPALEHLLRNSVAHGIEPPAQRQAAGKSATGRILLRVHVAGPQLVLSLFDDGRGLDTEGIRRKAVHLGLIQDNDPVDHARAAELILQPGLSTAAAVTEVAGRGIGMDAVADIVRALDGRLQITSTPGKGCRMDVLLPAPPQVEQVVAVRAGSWRIAIPVRSIEAMRRIPESQAAQALARGIFRQQDAAPLPLYWAGAVWQQSSTSLEPPLDGQRHLLVVRGETARWGLTVDEVLGTHEVTLQPPAHLEVPVPGLLGTASMPSGHVFQVYEPAPVILAHEARLLHGDSTETATGPAQPELPLVLLADDSVSVRRLAQHLLQTNGYRLLAVADGLEALQLLEEGLEQGSMPALLIADVEMPNIDGMELLRRVRSDQRLRELPVLMLTAHTAGPVSQRAISMGAQAFLTKPYAPGELLAQVRRYSRQIAD